MSSTFQDLNIADSTKQALADMQIFIPTEIQAKSIPILLEQDVDFIGLAQTGTGKTAAFGVPLVEKMTSFQKHIGALIIVPTRELCLQITEQLRQIAANQKGLTVTSVYGGAPITNQIKAIKKLPSIVVATPGRLIDLISRKVIKLHTIEYVVLDEADEMLNMGFQEDIDKILAAIKNDRRIWLFSATMPNPIRRIIDTYMIDPTEVSVIGAQRVNKDIEHQYLVIKASDKSLALMAILNNEPDFYGIIFCRTKRLTQELADLLNEYGFASDALHGDMSQAQRERVMAAFRKRKTKLIVATDVAARGIDVDDLTHIVHYNLPDDLSYYTHRSGRTARAGKKGISLALTTRGENRKIQIIQKSLKISIQKIELPSLENIQHKQVKDWAEKLMQIDGSHIPDALIDTALEAFDEIDGVELLTKLIAQLVTKDKSLQLESAQGSNNGDYVKLFVNIGKNDQCSKKELVELLLKNSSLRKKEIGSIDMSRRHAIVRIDQSVAHKTIRQLKGMKMKGRKIQVREDRK